MLGLLRYPTMMTPSKMRKTQAYQEGVQHADGGMDRRDQQDNVAAYDLGYQEHTECLALQRVTRNQVIYALGRKVDEARQLSVDDMG